MSLSPPIVLSIAATDPSGGAGLTADILTIASFGCHPLLAVTAVTVQDSTRVDEVIAMDDDAVADQLRMILEDMPVAAFKLGLLGSSENIAAIADVVADYPDIPLVLDPVLASGGNNDELTTEEMIEAMRELLLPQTTIITPNSLEARRLAENSADEMLSLQTCAARLIRYGVEHVLITGGHEHTAQVVNSLYSEGRGLVRQEAWERLPGSYHGSGCTLAAAIAAGLAQGLDVEAAVQEAQAYTWETLAAGFRAGMGQYIPNRLFWAKNPHTLVQTPDDNPSPHH